MSVSASSFSLPAHATSRGSGHHPGTGDFAWYASPTTSPRREKATSNPFNIGGPSVIPSAYIVDLTSVTRWPRYISLAGSGPGSRRRIQTRQFKKVVNLPAGRARFLAGRFVSFSVWFEMSRSSICRGLRRSNSTPSHPPWSFWRCGYLDDSPGRLNFEKVSNPFRVRVQFHPQSGAQHHCGSKFKPNTPWPVQRGSFSVGFASKIST